MFDHVFQRYALRAFGTAIKQNAIAAGNESFRHHREQIDRHTGQHDHHQDGQKRMRQHALQRPFVSVQDAVVDAFGESPPTASWRVPGPFVQRALANHSGLEQATGKHRREGQ